MHQQKRTYETIGLNKAIAAVGLAFFFAGAAMASWFSRVPAVKEHLALGAGGMGVMLAFVAVGSIVAMPLTGFLIARLGGKRVLRAAEWAMCAALILPAIAPGRLTLAAALTLLGAAHGLLDVAMNAQASALERAARRPLMPLLHALFSVGGLVGAVVGAALAHAQIGLAWHLGAIALLFMVLMSAAARYVPAATDPGGLPAVDAATPVLALPDRRLAGLAVIAFCAVMAEGVINDWSAIFLKEAVGTGAGFAALGYAAFSVTMVLGRLAGGPLASRVAAGQLMRGGGLLAAIGVVVCIAAPGGTARAGRVRGDRAGAGGDLSAGDQCGRSDRR